MAQTIELNAETRERLGTGATRAIRRDGRIPAVVYGENEPPQAISLVHKELMRHVETGTFLTTLFDINIGGRKTRVIPRELQFEPVREKLMHVDFFRLGKDATITVEIPVNFINDEEAPGIREGGILNVVRFAIELTCRADSIPDTIDADLTGLEMGASLHISDITLPEGAELTITDRDFTIATIAAPAEIVEEEEEDLDGLEGESAEGEEAEGESGEQDGEAEGGAEE